jgi:hypothetical protein
MLGSAGAGSLRNKLGFLWRLRSLWAKMSLLAVIFALVPLFLYFEFSKAYQDSQDLLLQRSIEAISGWQQAPHLR